MVLKKMIDALFGKNIKVKVHINPTVPKYDNDYIMIDVKSNSCS